MSYESKLQEGCNKFLRMNDILFLHREKGRGGRMQKYMRSDGFPDLVIFQDYKKTFFIELKSIGESLSTEQVKWAYRARQRGFKYYVCYSYVEFLTEMKEENIA